MSNTLDSVPVNSDGIFDPYTQNFILTMPDGKTQFAANIQTIFELQNTTVQQAVIYGVQIGLSALLLTILGLMTKADKRRSIVFILNMASLLLVFVRGIVQVVQLPGPFYNYYNWAASYYPKPELKEAQRESIASETLSAACIATILLSLMFQVRIVCCTLNKWWCRALDWTSLLVVLATVSVRFAVMVTNIMYGILSVGTATEAQRKSIVHLASAATKMQTVTIIFFSVVFCAKLAHAIHQRRKMGMKQFGPMQIIFVIGCQTLIVPAIFGIIGYFILPGSQIYTMMPTIVATFLPLSSIWASTNTHNNVNIAAPNQWQNRQHSGNANTSRGRGTFFSSSEKGLLPTTVNTDCTMVDARGQSVSDPSSTKPGPSEPRDRDSIDLEMQKMGRIRVDRAYSVRSD